MTLSLPEPLSEPTKKGIWASLKLHILHPELSPKQVAWSFGIGFSIAWNPLLGIHTILIILLCLLFKRLHRPLMFAAAFINNPWTMVPMATASTYLGNLLLGRGLRLDLSCIDWHSLGWRGFMTREGLERVLHMLKPILGPYLLGGMVFSAVSLPLGYFVMLKLSQRLRHLHLPHLHISHCSKD